MIKTAFEDASAFNGDLSKWDVSGVVDTIAGCTGACSGMYESTNSILFSGFFFFNKF